MAYRILAFDSGIGGLSIIQNLYPLLENYALDASISFLADSLVFPYGEQEDAFLIERIIDLIDRAIRKLQPDIIIIACNTASTIALDQLRALYPTILFVGCVPPIKWAAQISQSKHIGLLATRATVSRSYLVHLKQHFASDCELIAYGSPILASIAEKIFQNQPYNSHVIKQELQNLLSLPYAEKIDVICLGCTHYTFILEQLRYFSPKPIQWLDPAHAVAKHTVDLLQTQCSPSSNKRKLDSVFYHTSASYKDKTFFEKIKRLGFNTITQFV
ncbi:Glutamate racemase [Commensalibacter sp. Nvir]|uniref:glutamate racemase n=1 Tax=Commensalibacter sp. Nvir TaxID=3069817 RepID=UPI002D755D5E|nr:Glutamate racemase [Commensalibacter sp. Nvir]